MRIARKGPTQNGILKPFHLLKTIPLLSVAPYDIGSKFGNFLTALKSRKQLQLFFFPSHVASHIVGINVHIGVSGISTCRHRINPLSPLSDYLLAQFGVVSHYFVGFNHSIAYLARHRYVRYCVAINVPAPSYMAYTCSSFTFCK